MRWPSDSPCIRCVDSFEELVSTAFEGQVNALCWPRTLTGDFAEVVRELGLGEGVKTLTDAQLQGLRVSEAGRAAIDFMLEDQRRLREQGLSPVLDWIKGYPRDEETDAISTDVYSFHVDSAPVPAETWLCTYHGPPSEGLRNDQARRQVDVPGVRSRLLALYGGRDDEGFLRFLAEHHYDLHYAPLPGAQPFSFGIGNLWRLAVEHPGSPVPPCIHRAPSNIPEHPPRLLLIS